MSRRTVLFFAFIVWLSAAISCGSSDEDDAAAAGAVVVGFVSSDTGQALSDVTVRTSHVSTGQARTVTDARGRFQIPVSPGTVVLTFERAGFAPTYQRVEVAGDLTTVRAMMIEPTLSTTIDASSGPATLTVFDASVTFPAGSIVVSSTGEVAPGPVDAVVTYIDPEEAGAVRPAPMVGSDGAQTGPLISYGMLEVTLSYQGQPANLAPGMTATLSIASQLDDPPEAGLFIIDPAEGMWIKEGDAVNLNGTWTAEIPHFSWINIDGFLKVDSCSCLRFVCRDGAGQPLSGVFIDVRWDRAFVQGVTNDRGELCNACFPDEVPLEVSYGSFLDRNSPDWIAGTQVVSAQASGAACFDSSCTEVVINLSCTQDSHCPDGVRCSNGSCGGTGPNTNGGSCTYVDAEGGICITYPSAPPDVVARSCTDSGGMLSTGPCSLVDAIGTCTLFAGQVAEQTYTYYLPDATPEHIAETRMSCEQIPSEAGGPGIWDPIP